MNQSGTPFQSQALRSEKNTPSPKMSAVHCEGDSTAYGLGSTVAESTTPISMNSPHMSAANRVQTAAFLRRFVMGNFVFGKDWQANG